jgi:hypothetical protein
MALWGRREILHIGGLWEKMKMRDHLENLDINRRITLNWILKRLLVLSGMRGGTSDGIL